MRHEELPGDIRQILNKTPLSTKQQSDLLDEIMLAHCNKLPVEATRPMVEVQRIRDAVMSMSMLNSNADTRVLIAGAGHTRNDRGVPLYLRNHDKEAFFLLHSWKSYRTLLISTHMYKDGAARFCHSIMSGLHPR